MIDKTETLPCADKMAFDTQAEARNSALAVSWQRGNKLKVYQCKHCQLWHLSKA